MSKFISSIDLLGTVISITNTMATTTITTTSHHHHKSLFEVQTTMGIFRFETFKGKSGFKTY